MHRVVKVLLCLAITVGGFFANYERAHAAAPVVVAAGGIEVGAGVYVGAALAVAGVAGLIGLDEYSDEIYQHAYEVWDGAQQTVKDAFQASVDAAIAAGDYTLTLSKQVTDYFKSKESELIQRSLPMPRASTVDVSYTQPVERDTSDTSWLDRPNVDAYKPPVVTTQYPAVISVTKSLDIYTLKVSFASDSTYLWYDKKQGAAYSTLNISTHNSAKLQGPVASYSLPGYTAQSNAVLSPSKQSDAWIQSVLTVESTFPVVNHFFPDVVVLPKTKIAQLNELRRQALLVRPIGTVFPVSSTGTMTIPFPLDKLIDGAKPATGAGTGTIAWNPTARAWELDGIPYTGTVSWEFPVPRVDVGTGEVVIPDAGAGTANPPASGVNIPPFSLPSTATINLDPLKIAGDKLTTKFPFSIPWDVQRQLSVFNVSPVAPVLHVDKQIPVFGRVMSLSFDIDFRVFDPVATVVRWFLILAFDVAVILSLRRFLPE